MWEVDQVNLEWIESVASSRGCSATQVVSDLIDRVEGVDNEAFVFKKVRGCGRKKQKRGLPLQLHPDKTSWLESKAENHELPNADKALRVILDYALEDGA